MTSKPTSISDSSDKPPEAPVVIAFRNVHKHFGDLEVLRGVTFSVTEGSNAVVLGGSGSGKSVLIKHVVQLLRPDAGEIWVKGQRVDHLDGDAVDRLRLSIGYLFQGGALFDSMTVFENLEFLLKRHTRLSARERKERIYETLDWINLRSKEDDYPAELSGGQKKRIGLARAIILQPDILLYDEPTTGLDPVSVRTVSELIVRLRDERGITSITITHDLLCAEIIADEMHFLLEGRIAASGTLDLLRTLDDAMIRNFLGS